MVFKVYETKSIYQQSINQLKFFKVYKNRFNMFKNIKKNELLER